jgi:predicted DNA-binding antitoxin AbrB/MazE fold protein
MKLTTKSDLRDGEKIEVWITKYAFTQGIYETAVEVCKDKSDHRVFVKVRAGVVTYFHGNDWHLTEWDARNRGLEMIAAKRKKIKNTLAKLDELEKEWG